MDRVPRHIGQRAAAELRRYALSAWLTSKGRFGVLVITCILSGCAGSNAAPVPRTSASEIRVISGSVPDRCALLIAISASDGAVEPAARPFDGTRERAIEKLRSLAAAYGADTLVIDERASVATVGFEGARGAVVTLGANAYRCSSATLSSR